MNIPVTVSSLDPEAPFKKHTATIHVEGQLSLIDHKILNILYKCCYENDNFQSDYYYVKVSDIVEFLGWKKRVKKDIDDALNQLRVSGLRYNIFKQDKKNKDDWDKAGGTGFIASYLFDDEQNFIRFSLSPEIKSILQKPNIYALIDLRVQKKLKSKYEVIYYEYFLEELYRSGNTEMVTRWYSVSDIRRMLNVSPERFQSFKFLNRDCIKLPLKSLNESDVGLYAEVEDVQRVNRKVVAVNFRIKLTNAEKFEGKQEELSLGGADELIHELKYEVAEELAELFQNKKTVQQIIDEVTRKNPDCDINLFLMNNIEYAKRQNREGAVSNFLGFLRTCITNDYARYIDKLAKFRQAQQSKEDHEIRKVMKDRIAEESMRHNTEEFEKLDEKTKKEIYKACENDVYNFTKFNDDNKKLIAIEYFIKNRKNYKVS
ncbi:MAG: replication initiation protein [Candidatus Latescibacteria bacterium]|nr:replication initiation protein [Candidatus Latescibacterota bacterium]